MHTAEAVMDIAECRRAILAPPGTPRPTERWQEEPNALTAFREISEEYLAHLPPYPGHTRDRGILLCAGGCELYTNAWVCIQLLRKHGCTLPVQIWHLEDEISDAMKDLMRPLGVEFRDATVVRQHNPVRILNGWELKPFALAACEFREVLYLDADNVPVRNPEFLLETPQYRRTGAVFWPDYGRLDAARAAWAMTGVAYRDEPEFESGQIVLDRERAWRPLRLALWYNEHSDFVYTHIHGDKDTFHLAFRKCDYEYSMPARGIDPLEGAMCQHDFDGRRLFQHRNMAKWSLRGENPRVAGFALERECLAFLAALRSRWRGDIAVGIHGAVDAETQQAVGGREWVYERVGYDRRRLGLREDGAVDPGGAAMERIWQGYRDAEGPVLGLFDHNGTATCHLRPSGDGVWQGRWLRFEKMPIRLSGAET
jgi:hypothetical protein